MAKINVGDRFNKLVVVEKSFREKVRGRFWVCICDCENKRVVPGNSLRSGNTTSCGCYALEKRTKHGEAGSNRNKGRDRTVEFNIYRGILSKCYNVNSTGYQHYGARGIEMYEVWKQDFKNFRDYLLSGDENNRPIGRRPSPEYTLDRINVNGNYEPGNIRWATKEEQNNNKRNNVKLTIDGITRTVWEWSKVSGVPAQRIRERVKKPGWNPERVVMTPVASKFGKRYPKEYTGERV